MNEYLKNLDRIEFVITTDCTGKCKHCAQGEHEYSGLYIDKDAAAKVVLDIGTKYKLKSVMTFGGEALLYPESVFAVHKMAKKVNVPQRQLITNGYFSKNKEKIKDVVMGLVESGVNDVLLSVDAFHQEVIPLATVKLFVEEVIKNSLPIRVNPAWLVSREDNNEYNEITRNIVKEIINMGVANSSGNVIFPEGNACKYLREYIMFNKVENPYEENPFDMKAISIEPDGSLLGRNIYKEEVLKILDDYKPLGR